MRTCTSHGRRGDLPAAARWSRAPALPRLRRHIAGRLAPRAALFASWPARLRRRRALGEPFWVEDPDFGTWTTHVLCPLGSLGQELGRPPPFELLCDSVLSAPPRTRRRPPLGDPPGRPRLTGGRSGLVAKIHHALVDGRSASRGGTASVRRSSRNGSGGATRLRGRRPHPAPGATRLAGAGPSRWGQGNPSARGPRRRRAMGRGSRAQAAFAYRGHFEAGRAGAAGSGSPAGRRPPRRSNARIGPRPDAGAPLGGARRGAAASSAPPGATVKRRMSRASARRSAGAGSALARGRGAPPAQGRWCRSTYGPDFEAEGARQPESPSPSSSCRWRLRSDRGRLAPHSAAPRPAFKHDGRPRGAAPGRAWRARAAGPTPLRGLAARAVARPAAVQPDDLERPGPPTSRIYMLRRGADRGAHPVVPDSPGARRCRSGSSATCADCNFGFYADPNAFTEAREAARGPSTLHSESYSSSSGGAEEEGPVERPAPLLPLLPRPLPSRLALDAAVAARPARRAALGVADAG